jgi:hypothetical protein
MIVTGVVIITKNDKKIFTFFLIITMVVTGVVIFTFLSHSWPRRITNSRLLQTLKKKKRSRVRGTMLKRL